MARIRVNTEDLKNKAKDFDSAAEAFKRAGDDILAAAMSMPSYDGQLSGPARKMGYEFQKQARELSTALANDAESLRKTAQAFEEVDNRTINAINESSLLMSSAFIPEGPGGDEGGPSRQGGSPTWLGLDFLAYKDYGNVVYIWRNGEMITITITDENRELIGKYEDYLDEIYEKLADFFNAFNYLDQQYGNTLKLLSVLALLVGLGILTAKIFIAIASTLGAGVIVAELLGETAEQALDMAGLSPLDIIKECGKILDPVNPEKWVPELNNLVTSAQEASQALNNANDIWNTLYPPPPIPESPYVPAPPPPTKTPTPTPPPSP